jgi:hypothetical protein
LPPTESDLDVLQDRLERVLDPYRDRLAATTVYGLPFLARPGAKRHDWFAGVSPGNGTVRFFLLPMHQHPELLDDLSPRLRRRKTGASVLTFRVVDEEELRELASLVARSFAVYVAR